MKKFKIFLLLSLLVFFVFALSFEVHASGPKILQENTYLTFQSTSSFTLKTANNQKNWNGTLYYSTDTTTWNEWDGTTTLSSVGNKLYLRGTGNTIITGNSTNYRWVLTGSNIECIGNIENLLDYETVALGNHPAMANYCYSEMFNGCTSLTTAPSLPATTLVDNCYYYMFEGCTGLTTAPSLPATILAVYCYSGMFYGCTGLTTAPSLPATTLAQYCYHYMFSGCTSLTTTPSLPATTLANLCYNGMFSDCTSLTTVPQLPATTLAEYCYADMFYGCTGLKVSSTQTGSYLYTWRIPTSEMGTTASSWNTGMLSNTGGTFKGNPTINTTYYVENPPVEYQFNITFEENGGSSVTDLTEQTALPNPLPTPTKSGYTFRGWYYDSDFTNEAFAGDPLTDDVTLYAKWELNMYTITFNSNDGTTISDIEEATELPNPLPTPTKEGYTFIGWYYDSSFTQIANAGDPIESDVTLYAKWVSGKIFEEGDILPATTQLRISWDNIVTDYSDTDGGIYSNDIEFIRWYYPETGAAVLIFLDGYSGITGSPNITAGYIDIDISHLDTDQRTITEVVTDTPFYWQDMATYDYLDPKPFKAYDVLPATTQLKIYISGIHGNGTARYHISSTTDPDDSLTQGFYMATVQSDPNYNLVIIINGVTIIEYNSEIEPFPDYVVIDISHLSRSDRTIRYCDYPEEMGVMWEDLNPLDLESIYQEGYADGHQVAREYYGWEYNGYWYTGEEAWNMGREAFGYYDPITERWLSVEEYLDRYGTDKMDQSDFYDNFDKYFIPAMIIVFGGAIVLTVLKVFKGRE